MASTRKVKVRATKAPSGRKVKVEAVVVPATPPVAKKVAKRKDPAALERAYSLKWKDLDVIPGSYRLAGEHPDFPKKASVEVLCEVCASPHRRAVQDAWQCRVCRNPDCRKTLRRIDKEAAK